MRGNGRTAKCMAKVCIFGKMDESIRVSTTMIKNMEVESTIGLMGRYSKGIGLMERDRDREC